MKWLDKLWCKHESQKFIRNIHGDEINLAGGKRSLWICNKCGKPVFHDKLHDSRDDK